MILPRAEKREIVENLRRMISNMRNFDTMDQKEQHFKSVLEYLLTKPLFITSYPIFKDTVLRRIRDNKDIRGGNSIFIDYDYYYNIISSI